MRRNFAQSVLGVDGKLDSKGFSEAGTQRVRSHGLTLAIGDDY